MADRRKVVGGAQAGGGVPLLRAGCARRMKRNRDELAMGDDRLARELYAEVMVVVDSGRVTLAAARIAAELCLREIEDREEQIAEGADWTLGRRWRK